VKQGINSPLSKTSRQLMNWKKLFNDAEKIAVTKNDATKSRMIFLIDDNGLSIELYGKSLRSSLLLGVASSQDFVFLTKF
jgi:hypothetical protein